MEGRIMDRDQKILGGAKKVVQQCLLLKSNETLTILADWENLKTAEALRAAGDECGAEVVVLLMERRTRHGEDPPTRLIGPIKQSDAAVLASVFSLSNSAARIEACEAGTRVISIPGASPDLLMEGAIDADFLGLKPKVEALGALLSNTERVTIRSDLGTELTVKLAGRKSVDQTCTAHEAGAWSPFPILETAVGPAEDGINGKACINAATIPGGEVKTPITIEFSHGRVKKIEGGAEAEHLEKAFIQVGHPNMYQVVEFGLGLNPKAKIGRGRMAEDESQFGTVHFGLGQGLTFGVPVKAPAHFDIVMKDIEMYFDDTLMLKNGNYLEGPFKGFLP